MKKLLFLNFLFLSVVSNSLLYANFFSFFKENMQLATLLQQNNKSINAAVKQQSRFESRMSTKLNSISSNPIYNQQLFKKLISNALDRPRPEKEPLSFNGLPLDVRKLILNEYKKMGVKTMPHWDAEKQTLVIQTFAPLNTKRHTIIPDVDNPDHDFIYDLEITKASSFFSEKQIKHIKDVHYALWKNKPFHYAFLGAPIEKRKIELDRSSIGHIWIESFATLEKADGLCLIEFNPQFMIKHTQNYSSSIDSENTKQLAILDKTTNKTTYIGCPDPTWKNFTVQRSVSVQPNFATKVFAKTLQEIAQENQRK